MIFSMPGSVSGPAEFNDVPSLRETGSALPAKERRPRSWRHRSTPLIRYAAAFFLVGVALFTSIALIDSVHGTYFKTPFFFCAIVLSSWFGGLRSGVCATVLSILFVEFFFEQPLHSPGFSTDDLPRILVFLLTGGFISWLGSRQRRDEEALLSAREELEEKVKARTLDLQDANQKLTEEIAERTRQKARAEARTVSVMRANKTIPASLSSRGELNVDRLLGEVLSVIVDYLGEEGGGVWLYDAAQNRLKLRVVGEEGKIKVAQNSLHPAAGSDDDHTLMIGREDGAGLLPIFKDNAVAIFDAKDIATLPYLAPYRDYLAQKGVQSLLVIPLLAADDLLGVISVRCRSDSGLSDDEIAFVQAIAIHASLALRMSHLAESARQAVVAEERREALVRSKEALGRIAKAGRETLQRLAERPDVNTFLGHVLAVFVEQFGANRAALWLGDPLTGTCDQLIHHRSDFPHYIVEPGYLFHLEPGNDGDREALRPIPGRIITHRAEDLETMPSYQSSRDFLRELGVRTMIRIPLFFGTETRGNVHLLFRSDRTLSAEEEGLAHTLANQVVLALELTKLSEKAKTAALVDERNRMAADMHDTLAQSFAATLLHLRSMKMEGVPPDLQSHWKFAQDTAAEGLAAARRAINANRTAAPVDDRPLAERLSTRVRQVAARIQSDTKVRFQARGEAARISWAVEDELERLASEALFNAERHAGAGEISVKLDYLSGVGLRVSVRDDGRGFDQTKPTGSGLGLRSMYERAERIGASFTLITESGRGTEIVILWMADPAQAGLEPSENEKAL